MNKTALRRAARQIESLIRESAGEEGDTFSRWSARWDHLYAASKKAHLLGDLIDDAQELNEKINNTAIGEARREDYEKQLVDGLGMLIADCEEVLDRLKKAKKGVRR